MSAWQDLVREEKAKGGSFSDALKRASARYKGRAHESNPPMEHRENDDLGEQVEHGVGLGFGAVFGVGAALIAVNWIGTQVWNWANKGVSGPSP